MSGATYAAAVIRVLVDEFESLADNITADIVRNAVARHADQPQHTFECIIDNPSVANWRLKPHHDVPARVRLACCRVHPTPHDDDRERRINKVLNQLLA
jgi:hypothetical protein